MFDHRFLYWVQQDKLLMQRLERKGEDGFLCQYYRVIVIRQQIFFFGRKQL